MTRPYRFLIASALVAAMAPVGCIEPMPTSRVTLGELVAEHNDNARAIPRVWARARIHTALPNPEGGAPISWGSTSPVALPNGLLLVDKGEGGADACSFVLIGRELAGVELFRFGVCRSENVYYFWHNVGGAPTAYWGSLDDAADATATALAIDPRDLLAVLGVTEMPAAQTNIPAVALTMDPTPGAYAYVLHHLVRLDREGRIGLRRQTHVRWSDTQPRHAFMTRFFNDVGTCVMTAQQMNYIPVADGDEATPPVMPSLVQILWPSNNTRIDVALSEITAADKWDAEACLFRKNLPAGITEDRIIQMQPHSERRAPAP